MAKVNIQPSLSMTKLVDMTKVLKKVGFGPLWMLYLKDPADAAAMVEGVRTITDKVRAFKRDDIPERYHYKNHKYMADIMLLTNGDVYIGNYNSSMSVHAVQRMYATLQMRATRATMAWTTSALTPKATGKVSTQT